VTLLIVAIPVWVVCFIVSLRLLTKAWVLDFGEVDRQALIGLFIFSLFGPISLGMSLIMFTVIRADNLPKRPPRLKPGIVRRLAGNPPEQKEGK
jgi:hypothetical protein